MKPGRSELEQALHEDVYEAPATIQYAVDFDGFSGDSIEQAPW